MNNGLVSRYKFDRFFKYLCLVSTGFVVLLLVILLGSIVFRSLGAFWQPQIKVTINSENLSREIENSKEDSVIVVQRYLKNLLAEDFLNENHIEEIHLANVFAIDSAEFLIKKREAINGTESLWLPASSIVGVYLKNRTHVDDSAYLYILDKLRINKKIKLKFDLKIFTNTDSREPEKAGILGSLIGSILTISICLAVSLPIGVLAALFLEEYLPPNGFKYFLEININNLAAIPSIVYGLVGLAIFVNTLNLPRSSALVGGLTLTLLTLPTIIVAARQSIRSIPQSIKHGVLALGASSMQVTMHHILPLATPGIVTGSILSISRAIGETAPLIMIGMVAFIVDIPKDFLDPATSIPVLIYTWADSPEYGFVEKTSAAILFLILLIVGLNYCAIMIRKKYETRL